MYLAKSIGRQYTGTSRKRKFPAFSTVQLRTIVAWSFGEEKGCNYSDMKILTVNFLACAVKACKTSPLSFPLHFEDAELEQSGMEYNLSFLCNVLPRIDWEAFKMTANEVCGVYRTFVETSSSTKTCLTNMILPLFLNLIDTPVTCSQSFSNVEGGARDLRLLFSSSALLLFPTKSQQSPPIRQMVRILTSLTRPPRVKLPKRKSCGICILFSSRPKSGRARWCVATVGTSIG